MTGILLNEGKERKEELLLQAMKTLRKSQEASVWTQLVPNTENWVQDQGSSEAGTG